MDITGGSSPGDAVTFTFEGNRLRRNEVGFRFRSGIYLYNPDSQIMISDNDFIDSVEFGLEFDGDLVLNSQGQLLIRRNIFDGNDMAIRNNTGDDDVDARENWWGDATGPYHPDDNDDGLGDEVSGDVLFDPWYIDEGMTTLSDE